MNIMYKKVLRFFAGMVVLSLFFSGCSTRKNTLLTRNYHNLTSHYNIYFNAYEIYREGLKKVDLSFRDNYNQIIPVNVFSREEAARRIMSDMEKTKKKCSKLITTHSIKTNPKIKGGARTERQKEFLRRSEYNKWVDDSYLLMGKAHYHQHDFYPAIQNFEYIIREYKDESLKQEATLWLAMTHLELQDYSTSKEILDRLTAEPELDDGLRGELFGVLADWYLRQEQYSEAIDYLTRSVELTNSKQLRTRYYYILGQLYEEGEDFTRASIMYGEVLALNPDYEMEFNAKINRAKLYEGGGEDGKEIRRQLEKMLNDDKNIDFLDQIYYAIAELDLKEGNKEDAIENYKLSAFNSFSNIHQKTLSYLSLGELFYEDKEYIEAGAFYDSCVMAMPDDFPDAEEIRNHSYGLSLLAENLKVIKVEDSLLQMAAMPEEELNKLISQKIEEAKKIEEEIRKMEEESRFNQSSGSYRRYGHGGTLSRAPGSMSLGGGMLGSQYGTSPMGASLSGGGSGQWYFYNPTTISFGQSEFIKRFGRRKLEDNWRRSNKNIASANSDISTEGEEGDIESVTTSSKSKSFQPTTREYYTADIPFSDSARVESNKRIETALFNVGKILADELDKPEESINYFLELNERYPETEKLLFSYYNLYQLYSDLPDQDSADVYKNYILDRFPDSKSAMIIRNPNYFQDIEQAKLEVKDFYVKTYEDYLNGRYEKVLENCLFADTGFLLNPIRDKFGLLQVMAKAKAEPDNKEVLKDDLNTLVFKFPESEVTETARNLLNYLENGPSDSIKQGRQQGLQIGAITETAESDVEANYVYSADNVHYYIVIVSSTTTDVNRLKYNISGYNVENYDQDFFDVQSEVLTQNLIMISVKNFPDAKSGMDYYKGLLADPTVYSEFNETDFRHFIISKGNYSIFFKNKNVFNYIRFFNENYLSEDN